MSPPPDVPLDPKAAAAATAHAIDQWEQEGDWTAEQVADVWGTGSTPVHALCVSRDCVAVGGPEEVVWFTHPHKPAPKSEDEEEEEQETGFEESFSARWNEGTASQPAQTEGEEQASSSRWWVGGVPCGKFEVGYGSGVAAIVNGQQRAKQAQMVVGAADGRVLVLDLADMSGVGTQPSEQQKQQVGFVYVILFCFCVPGFRSDCF